jgi:hypothetical protein
LVRATLNTLLEFDGLPSVLGFKLLLSDEYVVMSWLSEYEIVSVSTVVIAAGLVVFILKYVKVLTRQNIKGSKLSKLPMMLEHLGNK